MANSRIRAVSNRNDSNVRRHNGDNGRSLEGYVQSTMPTSTSPVTTTVGQLQMGSMIRRISSDPGDQEA